MRNKKLNYRKTTKTLEGKTINKDNVMAFTDSIFTPKEKARLIILAKWSKNLNKDTNQYTDNDCNKWIEIWKSHLKANIISKATYKTNIKRIEAVRSKSAQDEINRIFSI